MGSEMCIRDSLRALRPDYELGVKRRLEVVPQLEHIGVMQLPDDPCLLYTSDAADERSSVDLGGRRIIKKKKKLAWHRHRSLPETSMRYK